VTPAKAALLAELMAERFPNPDDLEAESHAAAEITPSVGQIQARIAASDTPQACARRRRVLSKLEVTMRDVQTARVPLEAADDVRGVA
jgi:hypothetical protein